MFAPSYSSSIKFRIFRRIFLNPPGILPHFLEGPNSRFNCNREIPFPNMLVLRPSHQGIENNWQIWLMWYDPIRSDPSRLDIFLLIRIAHHFANLRTIWILCHPNIELFQIIYHFLRFRNGNGTGKGGYSKIRTCPAPFMRRPVQGGTGCLSTQITIWPWHGFGTDISDNFYWDVTYRA